MRNIVWLLVVIPLLAYAVDEAQSYPFQQYKVPSLFRGKPATPRLETPFAKNYKTMIKRGVAASGPNFAGHYTVVFWGCGTECAAYAIVDDRTGKVYEVPELSRGVDLGFNGPQFRVDSSLMVLANCPDPHVYGVKNCKRKYYSWDGSRLELLKSEAVQWDAGQK